MKWLLSLCMLISLSTVKAEVSQEQVGAMLSQMVKEGTISEQEAKKAAIKMNGMNADEWSAINAKADKVAAARKPASIDTIKETKAKDLDGAQIKQIQDDIKKIMPEYKE